MVRTTCCLLLATAVMTNFLLVGCSKSVAEKRAAQPTVGERINRDAVKGVVTDIGTNHLAIREEKSGEITRVRVNDKTKMDRVVTGDEVKAYVTDDGYASTIQRVER